MDDPNNTFDINQNPQTNPLTPETPINPLNTGNGLTSNEIPPTVPVQNSAEPHEIKLDTLAASETASASIPTAIAPSLDAVAPEPPTAAPETPFNIVNQNPPSNNTTPVTDPPTNNTGKTKLYIIIAIVTILVITLGYIGYSYFGGDSSEETAEDTTTEETETSNSLKNKLSESDNEEISTEMQELDNVVSDLKDIYSEKEESSSPPSLVIDLSANSTEETTPETEEAEETEETPKKISR